MKKLNKKYLKIENKKKYKAKKNKSTSNLVNASVEKVEINFDTLDFNKVVAITSPYKNPKFSFVLMTNDELFILPVIYEDALKIWSDRSENLTCLTAMDISENNYRGVANSLLLNNNGLH